MSNSPPTRDRPVNLPNAISLGRVLAVPLTVWLLVAGQIQWAFWVFAGAGLSDAVDGFIAKRFEATTELGRYLDPIADKILLVSVFIMLGQNGYLPAWVVILVVSRDFLIVGGALLLFTLTQPMPVRPLYVSKANTVMQMTLAALVLGEAGFQLALPHVGAVLVYVVAATTVVSGASYLVSWVRRTEHVKDPR